MKAITKDSPGVEVEIEASQDEAPVRGNAMASGDDVEDRAAEDEILARLDRGDIWAWACVVVTVKYKNTLTSSDLLGACSYANEADFRQPGGYFDDMVDSCIRDINAQLARLAA